MTSPATCFVLKCTRPDSAPAPLPTLAGKLGRIILVSSLAKNA
ncbi:hypothetical protein [Synechococcus sp. M16CYN]